MKTTQQNSKISINVAITFIAIALLIIAVEKSIAQIHSQGIISELSLDEAGNLNCNMLEPDQSYLDLNKLKQDLTLSLKKSITKTSKKTKDGAEIIVNYVGFESYPAAQSAFQYAVDIWAGLLSSDIPIRIYAEFAQLPSGQLGSAGPYWIVGNTPGTQRNTWYCTSLADKLAKENLIVDQENDPDIFAQFNSLYTNWYFGTDGNTPVGNYDFATVVLHELCHGFGFFGLMNYSGGIGYYGVSGYPLPAIFDHYTYTRMGRSLLNENFFPNFSTELGDALTGDQILFSGNNVIACTKGKRAVLFTYPIWILGTSYVHLDEFEYPKGNENSLMTPMLASGESILHPGPITLAIFDDIGWNGKVTKPYNENAAPNSVAAGAEKGWLTIFPNPVTNYFTVEVKNPSKNIVTANLYNEFGKVYYIGQWSLKEKSHYVDLSGKGMEPGLYFLCLELNEEVPIVFPIYKE